MRARRKTHDARRTTHPTIHTVQPTAKPLAIPHQLIVNEADADRDSRQRAVLFASAYATLGIPAQAFSKRVHSPLPLPVLSFIPTTTKTKQPDGKANEKANTRFYPLEEQDN
jgi:hypothetical protein